MRKKKITFSSENKEHNEELYVQDNAYIETYIGSTDPILWGPISKLHMALKPEDMGHVCSEVKGRRSCRALMGRMCPPTPPHTSAPL